MRRAASRLFPRLLAAAPEAAIFAQQVEIALLPRLATATAAAGKQPGSAAITLREFRSSAWTCHSALVDSLGEELAYEKENYTAPEELASGPPAGFSLSEVDGDTMITLTKQHGSETVTVDIMVNNQPGEDLVEEQDGTIDADVGAVFTVSVTKGDKSLVFECKSDGQYLAVLHVSLEPASGELEDSAYTGPVYEELDEQLQAHFERYLAERGVTEELGAFLLPLIHDKEQREYMRWLGDVQAFVRK